VHHRKVILITLERSKNMSEKLNHNNPEDLRYINEIADVEAGGGFIFETEEGNYDYDGKIIKVESETRNMGDLPVLSIKFYVAVPSGIICPEILFKMLDTKIKPGKDKSPRQVNHEIAWGILSQWLYKLKGISIGGFKDKIYQKAFKMAILFGFFGKKTKILVGTKDVDVEVPSLEGIQSKWRAEYYYPERKEGGFYDKLSCDWTCIGRSEEYEEPQSEEPLY
jgi:hypothetical protein